MEHRDPELELITPGYALTPLQPLGELKMTLNICLRKVRREKKTLESSPVLWDRAGTAQDTWNSPPGKCFCTRITQVTTLQHRPHQR